MLVVYNKMKNAYSNLAIAADLNDKAHKAADNLRSSAVFNIRALWAPVILFICAAIMIFTVLMMGTNSYHSGMGKALASVLGIIVFLGVLCVVAVLVYLFIAICFNIIGWYRMYKGGAALETQNESEEIANETVGQEPVEVENNSVEQGVKSEQNEKVEVSATSKPWLNKKTGMIAGGVLILVLIVLGISKCGGTENHFEVKVPTWEKFIMVTAEDVNLRKEPNVNSDKLMSVYDGYGGCEFYWPSSKPKYYDGPLSDKNVHHLTPGFEILPVINEVGDWYQVYVISLSAASDVEIAYIMKKYCKVMEPRKMDENAIQYLENNLNDKYLFLQSGKFKGYSLASLESDDVETYKRLKIGKVLENAMVYPEFATIIQKKEFKEGMDYTKPASVEGWADGFYESKFSLGFYDEFSDLVNCKRFTDDMIESIFGMFFKNEFSKIKMQYLFDVNGDSRLNTYTINLNEYEHQLVTK